jgi:hypothetical protein
LRARCLYSPSGIITRLAIDTFLDWRLPSLSATIILHDIIFPEIVNKN